MGRVFKFWHRLIASYIIEDAKGNLENQFDKGFEAMLELLKLTGVGPAKQIECSLAPRLNLITGDNGLGKTFLLECAWWALTGTWARKYQAFPRHDVTTSEITFQIAKKGASGKPFSAIYNWDGQEWIGPTRRDVSSGLSIFAQADGSFIVWDPAKYSVSSDRHRSEGNQDGLIHFSPTEIFDGVREEQENRTKVLCNGLIQDWVTWQYTPDNSPYNEFTAALQALSPHPTEEPLMPGQPTRLSWDDVRDIPTLKFPYGDVPILLCSAGIQRIVALAYLLVWAWNEHIATSKLMRKAPESAIVLLIDEMEAHLHPFWQRAIVPALMNVVQTLTNQVETQLIISTHSPLVLASVEAYFDHTKDNLFHLYLEDGEVKLDDIPFVKRGRVDLWLMSDLFGLKQPRSKVAEETIEEAKRLQQTKEPSKDDVKKVSEQLIKVLAQDDDFWPRWKYFAELRGVML